MAFGYDKAIERSKPPRNRDYGLFIRPIQRIIYLSLNVHTFCECCSVRIFGMADVIIPFFVEIYETQLNENMRLRSSVTGLWFANEFPIHLIVFVLCKSEKNGLHRPRRCQPTITRIIIVLIHDYFAGKWYSIRLQNFNWCSMWCICGVVYSTTTNHSLSMLTIHSFILSKHVLWALSALRIVEYHRQVPTTDVLPSPSDGCNHLLSAKNKSRDNRIVSIVLNSEESSSTIRCYLCDV